MPEFPKIMLNRVLLTLIGFAAAGSLSGNLSASTPASADALTAALVAARDQPQTPFRLDVNCSDESSNRALVVYRGRIGVWGGDRQVVIGDATREGLLTRLLDAGFPSFEARYGGRSRAPRQEAPLRVTCRVHLELGGLSKTSVQLLEGAQSEALLSLAMGLLDDVEPLTANGVAPADLEDGLTKLANGELAGEALSLRLTALPSTPEGEDGYILRIEDGRLSRQVYAPGRVIGTPELRPLTECGRDEAVAALRGAAVWELPGNLQRNPATELSVAVLGHRTTIIARPGFSPASARDQAGFEHLIELLDSRLNACADQAAR